VSLLLTLLHVRRPQSGVLISHLHIRCPVYPTVRFPSSVPVSPRGGPPLALHAPSNAPCTHSPRPWDHSGAPAQPEACNSARAPRRYTTLNTGKSASVSCENVKSFAWTLLRNRLNLTRCYLWCFSSLQVHRTPPLAGKPRGGGGLSPFFAMLRFPLMNVWRDGSATWCVLFPFSFSFADHSLLSHVHDHPFCPSLRLASPLPVATHCPFATCRACLLPSCPPFVMRDSLALLHRLRHTSHLVVPRPFAMRPVALPRHVVSPIRKHSLPLPLVEVMKVCCGKGMLDVA
jgi:hypothetical protein